MVSKGIQSFLGVCEIQGLGFRLGFYGFMGLRV